MKATRRAKPVRQRLFENVAIVGVGLIGGSIGKCLLSRGLARRVIGVGRDRERLAAAQKAQVISEVADDLASAAREADLVVICTPVDRIPQDARAAAAACRSGAVITDVGSTKANIVRALGRGLPAGVTFVGSHPLAGSERSGFEAAEANLFDGRLVVVTPGPRTDQSAVAAASDWWRTLGANVTELSPAIHDKLTAASSHVPHVAAAALAAATPTDALPLTAGGWLDTTRIAGGDPALWVQILLSNRRGVLTSLTRYEKLIHSFHRALERGDAAQLERLLEQGKAIRNAVGS